MVSKRAALSLAMASLTVHCFAVPVHSEEVFSSVGDGLVRGVSHDSETSTMTVLLNDGEAVTYEGVAPRLYEDFMGYTSQDTFYRKVIAATCTETGRRRLDSAILTDATGAMESVSFGECCVATTPRVRFGLDVWHSEGKAHWTTQFGGIDPALGPVSGTSKVTWQDSDSDCTVLNAEVMLTSYLRLSGRYGFGSIDDANTIDADHLSVPSYYVFDLFASEQRAESDGDTSFYDVNLNLAVSSFFKPQNPRLRVDVFAGYSSYKDEFDITAGRQTIVNYAPATASFPEPLNSTYDFKWEGVRLGVATVIPVSARADLSASVAVLDNVEYDGEGFWNLRDDLRSTSPNFVHKSGSGSGYDVEVALSYQACPYGGIRFGYRALEWNADDGRDTAFLADGSETSAILDDVHSERTGFFVGLYGQL